MESLKAEIQWWTRSSGPSANDTPDRLSTASHRQRNFTLFALIGLGTAILLVRGGVLSIIVLGAAVAVGTAALWYVGRRRRKQSQDSTPNEEESRKHEGEVEILSPPAALDENTREDQEDENGGDANAQTSQNPDIGEITRDQEQKEEIPDSQDCRPERATSNHQPPLSTSIDFQYLQVAHEDLSSQGRNVSLSDLSAPAYRRLFFQTFRCPLLGTQALGPSRGEDDVIGAAIQQQAERAFMDYLHDSKSHGAYLKGEGIRVFRDSSTGDLTIFAFLWENVDDRYLYEEDHGKGNAQSLQLNWTNAMESLKRIMEHFDFEPGSPRIHLVVRPQAEIPPNHYATVLKHLQFTGRHHREVTSRILKLLERPFPSSLDSAIKGNTTEGVRVMTKLVRTLQPHEIRTSFIPHRSWQRKELATAISTTSPKDSNQVQYLNEEQNRRVTSPFRALAVGIRETFSTDHPLPVLALSADIPCRSDRGLSFAFSDIPVGTLRIEMRRERAVNPLWEMLVQKRSRILEAGGRIVLVCDSAEQMHKLAEYAEGLAERGRIDQKTMDLLIHKVKWCESS